MNDITEENAWEAMDEYQPELALEIWNELIKKETNEERRDIYRSDSCYALLGLNKIDEARKIYLELFEKYKDHKGAHQLCMVEREAGNYEKALEYIEIEKSMLDEGQTLELAANLYEFGKIHELMKNFDQSLDYAHECLELSMKTDDLMMLGCANRLLGDIHSHRDSVLAKEFYTQAQKLFIDAGDDFGAEEIEDLISNKLK